MIARANAIIPVTPEADYTGKEGYFVKNNGAGLATLCTDVSDAPMGVITEGADTTGKVSVAFMGAGLAGTVKVKITATSPGTIVMSSPLELAGEDGTVKLSTGGGATVVATALESGAAGELIEAVLAPIASGTWTLDKTFLTTCTASAVGAVATISGQVIDGSGNPLSGYFIVGLILGSAANDGTPADLGTLAVTAGGTALVKEVTDDCYAHVQTKSDGTWSVALTKAADGTVHASAHVIGKTAAVSVVVDVP